MSRRTRWRDRPPVVVVCPKCDSGIFQNRIDQPIDCPNCDFRKPDEYLTEYEIIRFDCPDCGADIEDDWATRDLVGNGPPNTVTHVSCVECGMSWEAPHD
jgi:DNA-directed RNA polymerase subunit M/transcription elongation factor TFIIS